MYNSFSSLSAIRSRKMGLITKWAVLLRLLIPKSGYIDEAERAYSNETLKYAGVVCPQLKHHNNNYHESKTTTICTDAFKKVLSTIKSFKVNIRE